MIEILDCIAEQTEDGSESEQAQETLVTVTFQNINSNPPPNP